MPSSAADAIAAVLEPPAQGKRPREETAGQSFRDKISDMRSSTTEFLGASLDRVADRMEKRIQTVGDELIERIEAVGTHVQALDARQEATAQDQAEL